MDCEKTTLTIASQKPDSLTTTVPMSIVKQFGLKEGDEIYRKLGIGNGKPGITVEPNKKN